MADLRDLEWAKTRPWFYPWKLPDGTQIGDPTDKTIKLHLERARIMHEMLDAVGAKDRALDVACHEGWFTLELAKRFRFVLGFDKNSESIQAARRMARLFSVTNASLVEGHAEYAEAEEGERAFEVVLVLGLIYHVDNPLGLIRNLAKQAARAIILETQLAETPGAPDAPPFIAWGPNGTRTAEGWFALVKDDTGRDGGTTGAAMVPTRSGVYALLDMVGFAVEREATPAPGRLMVLATRRG